MEKDEAVSTVIALMLILGIVSTLIAIYSAAYLPGLKQQSEIEHSREVANAFARFGSHIEYAVSHKVNARFSEPFSLGGGDILLSPVRSSGLLTIERQPLVDVIVTQDTGTDTQATASLANISYVPSFTSWEPQGYRWEYGVVSVTKDGSAVPQSSRYDTMNEALDDSGDFLRLFVDLNQAGTNFKITVVNLTLKKGEMSITGSGRATLGLNATVSEADPLPGVTEVVFEDLTFGRNMPGMEDHLKKICTEVEHTGVATYTSSGPSHTLTFSTPVTVTLRTVNAEVSVW